VGRAHESGRHFSKASSLLNFQYEMSIKLTFEKFCQTMVALCGLERVLLWLSMFLKVNCVCVCVCVGERERKGSAMAEYVSEGALCVCVCVCV